MDQHGHSDSGVHFPREVHLQLWHNNPAAHDFHQADPLPSDLQVIPQSGRDARARARDQGDQRQVSRHRERHDPPAEDNGSLFAGRRQPDVGLSAHSAPDAGADRHVRVLPLVHRAARPELPLGT